MHDGSLSPTEHPGDRIGPYELLEPLGSGGFGTVWKARRREPFEQLVAIKIVKPGMDSEAVLARFAQERQTLARMEHPGIARVLDGGMTPRGRPYFVMELVEGAPITEWCDARRFPIGERVALLAEVADAVQHAHAKGVIHRDLKPSNILVSDGEDGRPRPRVIDFGIAKALVGDGEGQATLTELGQTLGTPAYMSPEQADLDGGDVDTRSDVYGLGAVLFELLAGQPPFGGDAGSTRSRVETLRAVRGGAVPRPGGLATTAEVAARRATSPGELAATLSRDLEWIPLKALRREPEGRYPSAAALAADLRAWRDGRPIEAAPESIAYRVRTFVRRNRLAVAAGAVIAASLVAATGVSAWFAFRERDARLAAELAREDTDARAREAARVASLQSRILANLDAAWVGAAIRQDVTNRHAAAVRRLEPDKAAAKARVLAFFNELMLVNRTDLGIEVLDRWILDAMSEGTTRELADLPLAVASIRHGIANSRWTMRQLAEARREIDEALAIRRERLGATHPETLSSLALSARIAASEGRVDRAIDEARTALAGLGRPQDEADDATIFLQQELGDFLVERGDPGAAIPLLEEAVASTMQFFGPDDVRVGGRRSSLGAALLAAGKAAEAEPHLREGLELRVRTIGPDARYTIRSQAMLGDWLAATGRIDEAAATYADALARSVKTDGSDHPSTIDLRLRSGRLEFDRGATAAALESFRLAADSAGRTLGADHPTTSEIVAWLVRSLAAEGRTDEARAALGDRLESTRAALGEGHPATLRLMLALAAVHASAGEPDREHEVRVAAIARARSDLPPLHSIRKELESPNGEPTAHPVP